MKASSLRQLVPSWVEPDPLRGRAVDALGLQPTSEEIAEQLVPGLSVLTTRARYFALLAWARHVCGARVDERRIHRLEVALAVREAMLHKDAQAVADADSERCRYVGSRSLATQNLDRPPRDPTHAFRQPVWRAYRASMQNLGLLDRSYALTEDGVALARRFVAACRPNDASGRAMLPASACLSALTLREAGLLRDRLGVQRKGKLADGDASPAAKRCATERTLRHLFDGGYSLTVVLAHYEGSRSRALSSTAAALREAAIWERLSIGLNAVFLLFLKHIRKPAIARGLVTAARRRRARVPKLEAIAIDEAAAATAIASVRHALALRSRLGNDGVPHSDTAAFELGEELVSATPVDAVFSKLADRHVAAKADDAWFRARGRGLELARDHGDTWTLPPRATLHRYRLGAFGQILHDLHRAGGRW